MSTPYSPLAHHSHRDRSRFHKLDVETFLTALYVMVDDLLQSSPPKHRPVRQAYLCESEVITLTIFGRWSRFSRERNFYRYASDQLREAFPTLPGRSQFNSVMRFHANAIEERTLHLAQSTEGSGHGLV